VETVAVRHDHGVCLSGWTEIAVSGNGDCRWQVYVFKSEMKLGGSFKIRSLILILRAYSKWSEGLAKCHSVSWCAVYWKVVLGVRGKVEGQLWAALLAFSFHPKWSNLEKFVLSATLRSVDG
jgi:hypothetical protein